MLNYILNSASYVEIFVGTVFYFLFLYFIIGKLFLAVCKYGEQMSILHKITNQKPAPKQVKFEIKKSIQSIFIFGLSALPVIYLYRTHQIHFLPNTLYNVVVGLIFLNIYNELHFYIVHRIMHTPLLMKRVHWVHHKTKIPTIQSVYSFHWLEATLLSSVMLTIIPFIDLASLAVGLYPLTSILFNFSGHCNYRFGKGEGTMLQLLGTNHHDHHTKGKRHFGFALPLFDFLTKLQKDENQ